MKIPKSYLIGTVVILISVLIGEFANRLLIATMLKLLTYTDPHVTALAVSFLFRPVVAATIGTAIIFKIDLVDSNNTSNKPYLVLIYVVVGTVILSWLYVMFEIRIGDYWP